VINVKGNYSTAIFKTISIFLLLTALAGCTDKNQTITGQVVDEAGAALSGVAVSACYSGWGWSHEYLVWDKEYCSKPVFTNIDGSYVIIFSGPDVMRLRVKKDGWIQTQDFNSKDALLFLTRNEEYRSRQATDVRLQEFHFRQRLADESDADYYCRVVKARSRPVSLIFQGATLSIVPSLLRSPDHNGALFAVRGSALAASAFTDDVRLRIDGQAIDNKIFLRPDLAPCASNLRFMEAVLPPTFKEDSLIEIIIPSVRAAMDMQIWSVEPKP